MSGATGVAVGEGAVAAVLLRGVVRVGQVPEAGEAPGGGRLRVGAGRFERAAEAVLLPRLPADPFVARHPAVDSGVAPFRVRAVEVAPRGFVETQPRLLLVAVVDDGEAAREREDVEDDFPRPEVRLEAPREREERVPVVQIEEPHRPDADDAAEKLVEAAVRLRREPVLATVLRPDARQAREGVARGGERLEERGVRGRVGVVVPPERGPRDVGDARRIARNAFAQDPPRFVLRGPPSAKAEVRHVGIVQQFVEPARELLARQGLRALRNVERRVELLAVSRGLAVPRAADLVQGDGGRLRCGWLRCGRLG